jgi:biopolymer transport protein ExbD
MKYLNSEKIRKCVGQQSFAPANCFYHCQIKKSITFLPLLALLLMAFCKRGENATQKENLQEKITTSFDTTQKQKAATSLAITQKQSELTNQIITIKTDGNYIDNKLCSLEEITKKGQGWMKSGKYTLLLIDKSIPYKRIDEVRETLSNAKVYLITQSTVGSDEIVFFCGDVNKFAKFSKGELNDWISSQLNNYPEFKSKTRQYRITYTFIVGKDGKVRDAHIIKGTEYPEVNAAWEKILNQIPNWEPAMRGNEKVSVYYWMR